jgi:hypothetical protein
MLKKRRIYGKRKHRRGKVFQRSFTPLRGSMSSIGFPPPGRGGGGGGPPIHNSTSTGKFCPPSYPLLFQVSKLSPAYLSLMIVMYYVHLPNQSPVSAVTHTHISFPFSKLPRYYPLPLHFFKRSLIQSPPFSKLSRLLNPFHYIFPPVPYTVHYLSNFSDCLDYPLPLLFPPVSYMLSPTYLSLSPTVLHITPYFSLFTFFALVFVSFLLFQ